MAARDDIAERIRASLSYDPETGVVTNKISRSDNARAGEEAGYLHSDGARYIHIKGRMLKTHRVAWLLAYGEWPSKLIDHINGKRDDNRLCNLRDVSASINQQNRRLTSSPNSTGFMGVHKHGPSYRCEIRVDGKRFKAGPFKTAEEAHAVYLSMKRRLHPGCTI